MKRVVLILLSIFFLSSYAHALDKVVLQLNWKYQFEFAGYIAAKEKGFYRKAGLDVEIRQYNGGDVINNVLSGKANFGVVGTEIFAAMILKKPVVMVANFFKRSPLVLAVKPSIFTPEDLQGKVFLCGGADIRLTSVGLLLKKFGIHFKKIIRFKGPYTIKPFVEGRVDAIPIYITNQTYTLNKLGVRYNIIDPSNYGIFAYSGNLFTSKEFLKKHPDIVSKFVKATVEGWEYALRHKKEISRIIYTRYKTKKSLKALYYEANKIQSIIMPSVYPIGFIDKNVVEDIVVQFASIMGKPTVYVSDFIFARKEIALTDKEREFLNRYKTVKICINPDWKPIEYLENGKAKGISIEVLKKVLSQLSLNYRLIKTKSWRESQEFLKEGKCDVLPSAVRTPQREKYALFTKPYINYELFVFSKKGRSFIVSLDELKGKTIARKKGSALIQILKNICPHLEIIQTNTIADMFKYVHDNRAYCTIATLPVATYYLRKLGYNDITIIGSTGISYPISIAVRKDLPLLRGLLDRSLALISREDVNRIWSRESMRHIKEQYSSFLIKSILQITTIFSIIVLVLFFVLRFFLKKNRELAKTKQQLEESLKNFETLTKYSMQMTIISKDGKCIDVNDVACKTLGYSKDEILGRSIYDFITDDCIEIVRKKQKLEHTQPYELKFKRKDGDIVYTLAKGDNIVLNGEKVRLGTAVDITELKVLQEKLSQLNKYLTKRIQEETEKNLKKDRMMMQQSKFAATGEMMAMIAHQWRQPLNAISATVNNLLLKIQMGECSEDLINDKLKNIMEYVKHLSSTIDDFRNFFRPEITKEEAVIDDIIVQIVKITRDYIEAKNIKIDLHLNCKKRLLIHSNELKHVILNFINNSRDAIVERRIKEPVIKIETKCDDKGVIIAVEDNAGGIPEDILPKIFEPYFTTKDSKKGTGLGLYMSKIMVEEHMNGEIVVENTDEGVRFEIRLPLE
ncbi:ABC transporter substrate-binding protein [Hippea alviniae]|uniref:ABC transporter substrate-binding protein n=1 Tax=Hippea alviniae TaxID=1279027 RepID=UPI0003B4D12F|nr:ABC transporter substrate-binding protein [Hippea alviniae]